PSISSLPPGGRRRLACPGNASVNITPSCSAPPAGTVAINGELSGLDEAELDQPVPHAHPFAKTKLLALLWCAHHEMLHAGQVGLLRRHLGYPPMW
ncbi:MAG TPA: hypothetical protein VG013_22990, partial [Gemmataceae bacterium]|nr:hypothetical protein [Gemmataceae bacterium]